MAVTAKFLADFSSFQDAVAKAETSLKGFESEAGKVEKSLNKMGDAFSGRKVVQDAELATKAVMDLGGATKLTQSEQARLNAQLTEALAKYKAIGLEAPRDMVALATATQGASKATTDILGTVGKFAGAVGIGFSVGAVVSFGKSVLDSASQIHDMAEQLGISAEATQGFKFAAEQAGSSIDAVGSAITRMNKGLAEGDKSTISALQIAGLNFADIRQMRPEDAFLEIADAIQKIPDPMVQTQIALQLFGKSAAELLPAIKEGFRGVSDSASKMSDETIKDLEAAQDSWDKLSTKVTIVTGKMIADSLNFLNVWKRMNDDIDRSTPKAPKAPASGVSVGATDLGIDEEELKRAEAALNGVRAKLDAVAEAHQRLIQSTRDKIFGTDTITGAKSYVEALGSVVNLSRVNSVEQEKINKSIGEALDVYKRFGQVAPQAMRDLFIATSKMPDAIAGIPGGIAQIGTQFELVTPKITDVSKLLTYMAGIPFGVKVGQQVDFVVPKVEKFKANLGDLSRAMSELATISGGTFGTIASGLATLVSAANTAQKAITGIKDAQKALKAGEAMEGILGMATGIAGLVTAAVAAGQAIKSLFGLFDRNKGRDLVVDFAESFGGFDQLHEKLLMLGADGEALWIKLTQGVGRNNPQQAQRVIDEVNQALDEQAQKQDEATTATEEQAQATIETATQAALALDELGGKLDISKQQWKDWGAVVTGELQALALSIRSLPLPSPGGESSLSFGAGSRAGATTIRVPVYLDGSVITESVARDVMTS